MIVYSQCSELYTINNNNYMYVKYSVKCTRNNLPSSYEFSNDNCEYNPVEYVYQTKWYQESNIKRRANWTATTCYSGIIE